MFRRNLTVGAVLIAMSLSVLIYGANTTAAGVSVSGGGSTTAQNLIERCKAVYAVAGNGIVNYSGVGSTAGRTSFSNGIYDFGFTDIPYSDLSTAPADLTYVPVVATPIAVAYRISTLTTQLNLRPATLARIFAGQITNCNDSRITADNGIQLFSLPIKVVYRSNAGPETSAFTSYLNVVAPDVWTKSGSDNFSMCRSK